MANADVLTPAQQNNLAIQCKKIMTETTAPLSQTQAQQLLPTLKMCVKNISCQNSNLSNTPDCAKRLSDLYFAAEVGSLSSAGVAPMNPNHQTTRAIPAQQTVPLAQPSETTGNHSPQSKKQEESQINW